MKLRFGSLSVNLKRADKVLFPADELTKRDLIDYYLAVADRLLPILRNRPLTQERYPDGIEHKGFFQKEAPANAPPWLDTVEVSLREPKDGATTQRQVLCNRRATLAWLVDQACVTPHVWSARRDALERPDHILFDLDPAPGAAFESVRVAALRLCAALDADRLPSYLKTTGSRGVHVVVPIRRDLEFDAVRAFARDVAARLAARFPGQLTLEQRKEKRGERLYLDVTRNAYAQTSVAAYGVRARPGAPVAMPIPWPLLEQGKVAAQSFRLEHLRSGELPFEDPWRGWRRHAVDLRSRIG